MLVRPLVVLAALVTLAGAPASLALAQNTTSVTLSWTAPGDDGSVGTAAQYEVRVSTSLLTDANFAAATLVPNPPLPLPAGSAQSMFVGGLQTLTQYWVAVRTADERGNWSAISNVVAFTTSAGDTIRQAAADIFFGNRDNKP